MATPSETPSATPAAMPRTRLTPRPRPTLTPRRSGNQQLAYAKSETHPGVAPPPPPPQAVVSFTLIDPDLDVDIGPPRERRHAELVRVADPPTERSGKYVSESGGE